MRWLYGSKTDAGISFELENVLIEIPDRNGKWARERERNKGKGE